MHLAHLAAQSSVSSSLAADEDTASQVRGAWTGFLNDLDHFADKLPILGVALAIMVVAIIIAKLVSRWEAPFRLLSTNSLLRAVLRNVVSTVIIVAGIVAGLEILDATTMVGTLLGAAGVVGLALGFAFQNIVENYLASVLLAVRRPFSIRDLVEIDGHTGKVMSLTTRATVLMTPDGNHLRLPNAQVYKAVITNFTRNPRRRFEFSVGAGTEEDLNNAQALGVETLCNTRGVMAEPVPFSLIDALGDSTVSIQFLAWVDQGQFDFLRVRSEAIRRVKVAFDQAEIQMPEPTYRVSMVDPSANKQATKPPRELDHTDTADLQSDQAIDRQIAIEGDHDPEGANLLVD